jgi:Baseplate J-like protein
MSINCTNKNTLLRNGTSQPQRRLRELLPDYIGVDERSMEELLAFAKQFATEIKFYDVNLPVTQVPAVNWTDFFNQSLSDAQRTAPHFALFSAFLELFSTAQNDLNGFTERHLDFYYRDVLQLKEKPAAADQLFIIFKLAGDTTSLLIKNAAEADAGKDASGADLVYTVDNDLVVNRTEVAELKAAFIDRNLATGIPSAQQFQLYASSAANSADGKGAAIETEEKRWKIFGRPAAPSLFSPADYRPFGELGFAFSSPVLWLAEGRRTITLTLSLSSTTSVTALPPVQPLSSPIRLSVIAPEAVDVTSMQSLQSLLRPTAPVLNQAVLSTPETSNSSLVIPMQHDNSADIDSQDQLLINALEVYFSGEKEWLKGLVTNAVYDNLQKKLTLTVYLAEAVKPVVGYQEEVLKQPFRTSEPVVKVLMNQTAPGYPALFQLLNGKTLFSANVRTEVKGVRNLLLQSDDSFIKPDKPFMPFGNRPQLGSTFYIGSPEVMSKSLERFNVSFVWHGRPDNFANYYNHYNPDSSVYRNNDSFKVQADLLVDRNWRNIAESLDLFSGAISTRRFNFNNTLPAIGFDTDTRSISEFTPLTRRGFLRLTLKGADFGHNDFQSAYAQRAIYLVANPLNPDKSMPREPYTPVIKSIQVDYTASDTVRFFVSSPTTQTATFYHVEPFGIAAQQRSDSVAGVEAMPLYAHEGNLFIGLRNVEVPQLLTLLFKVAEGSADPDVPLAPLIFSYLVNNRWVKFSAAQIIGNTTNNLLDSGIVTLSLPRAMTTGNTLLTEGLGWIRVSAENYSASICDLIDVKAQAVTATFSNRDNDPAHLSKPLKAGSLIGMLNDDDGLRTAEQPYASFGGHSEETPEAFRIRVSERLRHKQRAITIWDYEHLVLEAFPSVFRAKAINHTRMEKATLLSPSIYSETSPGHTGMVLVADLRNKNAVNPLRPRLPLLTLEKVKAFLQAIMPPLAKVHVRNPYFEEIQLSFDVKFKPGFDISFYSNQLQTDIRNYLAPWLSGTTEISFGGRIHKSAVIDMLDELPYVDYVTCVQMNQLRGDLDLPNLNNIETATPTRAASALTSATQHNFTVLETESCDCPDNDVQNPFPQPGTTMGGCGEEDAQLSDGVGFDRINNDFIVGHSGGEGVGYWTIEDNFNIQ